MPETSLDRAFSSHGISVSRETLEKMEVYKGLLLKWQKAINLVSAETLDQVNKRHFVDSAQVFSFITDKDVRLADMGSGAGFPGMVLAMMGVKDVHLIESDVRKATFLREVSRETKTPVTIHDSRLEDCKIPDIDVFTARAFSSLKNLLAHSLFLSTADHRFYTVFLKGKSYIEEVEEAKKLFNFNIIEHKSVTENDARLLKLEAIASK